MLSHALFASSIAVGLLPLALGCTVNDLPAYCDPGEPYNCDNIVWYDTTADCQRQGLGLDNCCVTVVAGSGGYETNDYSEQNLQDLESAVGQQLEKDGQFDGTTAGIWEATFGVLGDDKIDSNVDIEYFRSLNEFWNSTDAQNELGGIGYIFFTAGGSGAFNQIVAMPSS